MPDAKIGKSRHVTNEEEVVLCQAAAKLSEELDGTDIVIIAAGKSGTRFGRCMTGSTTFVRPGGRLRDLLGILETAKQIETLKHFGCIPKPSEHSKQASQQAVGGDD